MINARPCGDARLELVVVQRVQEQYTGEAECTQDFKLGDIHLAHDTLREIQQHQPHGVPWR